MKTVARTLVALTLAGCEAPAPPATVAPRYHLAKAPDALPLGARWAYASGVLIKGLASMGVSLRVSQDPVTGRIEGSFFGTQAGNINKSYLGRLTGGTIGVQTAHLTGQLVDGSPFKLDLTEDAPGDQDLLAVQIPGQVTLAGTLHAGDIRVVQAFPPGVVPPGAVFDFRVGVYVPAAQAEPSSGEPADVPDAELVAVQPDPVELPNATFPGTFNNVPGIGLDIPIYQTPVVTFPLGVPRLEPNHPAVLGVDIFGA